MASPWARRPPRRGNPPVPPPKSEAVPEGTRSRAAWRNVRVQGREAGGDEGVMGGSCRTGKVGKAESGVRARVNLGPCKRLWADDSTAAATLLRPRVVHGGRTGPWHGLRVTAAPPCPRRAGPTSQAGQLPRARWPAAAAAAPRVLLHRNRTDAATTARAASLSPRPQGRRR